MYVVVAKWGQCLSEFSPKLFIFLDISSQDFLFKIQNVNHGKLRIFVKNIKYFNVISERIWYHCQWPGHSSLISFGITTDIKKATGICPKEQKNINRGFLKNSSPIRFILTS